MSNIGDDSVEAGIQKSKMERLALLEVRGAKVRKLGSRGKGKGVVGSSGMASPCVTSDDTAVMPPPRSIASRGKVYKAPSYFDVDRCTRWEAPSGVSEERRDELEKLPVLPKPRKTQGFGVIGAAPEYAYDVLAPYMSFEGDESRLRNESSVEGFGAMLEDSAALMARLSFHSRAMVEREVNLEKCHIEREAEMGRMRVALDESVVQRSRLVEDAVSAYNKGVREGGMEGWSEAVKAYKEAGYLDQAAVDSVICHLALSDGEEELMEDEAAMGNKEVAASSADMMP